MLEGARLPKVGYSIKLAGALATKAGVFPAGSFDSCRHIPMGTGTCNGIAALTGDPAHVLLRVRALGSLRLWDLAIVIKEEWNRHGKKNRAPVLSRAVLAAQLCQWQRSGYGASLQPIRAIELAA